MRNRVSIIAALAAAISSGNPFLKMAAQALPAGRRRDRHRIYGQPNATPEAGRAKMGIAASKRSAIKRRNVLRSKGHHRKAVR